MGRFLTQREEKKAIARVLSELLEIRLRLLAIPKVLEFLSQHFLNSTSTNLRGKIVCETAGMHATGMLELVAADPEHVNGSYHSTVDGNDHTMNLEGVWTSKWLGSSCGDVK